MRTAIMAMVGLVALILIKISCLKKATQPGQSVQIEHDLNIRR